MEKSQIRECQLKQLEALKHLDKLCKDNGLTYYAHTGTLLGAARHGGYIPWDMDTDIIMPQEDCKRLIEIILSEGNPLYTVKEAGPETLGSDRLIAKTALCYGSSVSSELGKFLHIDIYSLTWAKKRFKRLDGFYNFKARLFGRFISYRNGRRDIAKLSNRILITLMKIFYGRYTNAQLRDKIVGRAVSDEETEEMTVPNSFYGYAKETYPKELFADKVMLPFEDMEIPAPAGYDGVLTTLYGNWRSLPPEDKRYPAYLDQLVFEIVDNEESGGSL